jgi:hypothetical protein
MVGISTGGLQRTGDGADALRKSGCSVAANSGKALAGEAKSCEQF